MILDTCALLWLAQGSRRLSAGVRRRLDAAPVVHVVAITAFEVALKYARGRLRLPLPPRAWLAAVVAHHDLDLVPLDEELCIRATELPAIHRDPCDRFIIAAAMQLGLPVVTSDPVFAEYGVEVVI
ncbi:MAG: type II toxin-antitoxin system VapC family toxin [Deltaproteobacteria bacterium]|nr:type II toxin-antitoxin system VapC family toxin [Deltaproteobacteria bacterium]